MSEMRGGLHAWGAFVEGLTDWEALVEGVEPKQTPCGPVYELPNSIADRPNESFAIADMRHIKVAEPHYHTGGETEIYFVLQGSGLVVVGGKEEQVQKGSLIVIPPQTAHFTVPQRDLVLAIINTPPFKLENVVTITETDRAVGFNKEQFKKLTAPK